MLEHVVQLSVKSLSDPVTCQTCDMSEVDAHRIRMSQCTLAPVYNKS